MPLRSPQSGVHTRSLLRSLWAGAREEVESPSLRSLRSLPGPRHLISAPAFLSWAWTGGWTLHTLVPLNRGCCPVPWRPTSPVPWPWAPDTWRQWPGPAQGAVCTGDSRAGGPQTRHPLHSEHQAPCLHMTQALAQKCTAPLQKATRGRGCTTGSQHSHPASAEQSLLSTRCAGQNSVSLLRLRISDFTLRQNCSSSQGGDHATLISMRRVYFETCLQLDLI